MKKLNMIFYVIGTVCIIIAGYIIYDKYFTKDMVEVNFNEEEELVLLNNKLAEVGSSLGWVAIVDGINNQDRNGNYVVTLEEDLFSEYEYRQLFVMEYILSNTSNYDKFDVLDMNGNEVDDDPTSEFTMAYLDYNDYNEYYKSLFGEDFDINKAKNGNSSYDSTHVYYDNRRAGSNGVYVSMIQASDVDYDDGVYSGTATVTYSTRASELVGNGVDTAVIEYTKDINENIILKSFVLKDR